VVHADFLKVQRTMQIEDATAGIDVESVTSVASRNREGYFAVDTQISVCGAKLD
jgi:hypothetical protein